MKRLALHATAEITRPPLHTMPGRPQALLHACVILPIASAYVHASLYTPSFLQAWRTKLQDTSSLAKQSRPQHFLQLHKKPTLLPLVACTYVPSRRHCPPTSAVYTRSQLTSPRHQLPCTRQAPQSHYAQVLSRAAHSRLPSPNASWQLASKRRPHLCASFLRFVRL